MSQGRYTGVTINVVTKVLQRFYRGITGCHRGKRGVAGIVQKGCYKGVVTGVLRIVFQGCPRGVPRVSQGCDRSLAGMSQGVLGYRRSVTGVLQGCPAGVYRSCLALEFSSSCSTPCVKVNRDKLQNLKLLVYGICR
jgi:hypothetical protein